MKSCTAIAKCVDDFLFCGLLKLKKITAFAKGVDEFLFYIYEIETLLPNRYRKDICFNGHTRYHKVNK
jgi:hypothetical protein